MRTTLDLDDLAMEVLRDLATVEKRSIGKVATELILEAVNRRAGAGRGRRNGVPLLEQRDGVVVTNELIDRIREAESAGFGRAEGGASGDFR